MRVAEGARHAPSRRPLYRASSSPPPIRRCAFIEDTELFSRPAESLLPFCQGVVRAMLADPAEYVRYIAGGYLRCVIGTEEVR